MKSNSAITLLVMTLSLYKWEYCPPDWVVTFKYIGDDRKFKNFFGFPTQIFPKTPIPSVDLFRFHQTFALRRIFTLDSTSARKGFQRRKYPVFGSGSTGRV